ncbi:unnamed protein product, partial [Hapterophycus canaliculatus]
MTKTMPLDDQMMRLRRQAQEREEKLVNRVNADAVADRVAEDTGAAVDEHADTWGFSWMPAIEDFVKQAAEAAERRGEGAEDRGHDRDGGGGRGGVGDFTDDDDAGDGDEQEAGSRARATGYSSLGGSGGGVDSGDSSSSSATRSGGKRSRPRQPGATTSRASWSPDRRGGRRRTKEPRPPSYNEILLADKSFHNPHASETMADAFGILRPASFVLEVEADDRSLGGAGGHANRGGGGGGGGGGGSGSDGRGDSSGLAEDRSWFYDTVRDRQNRLWADTRVRKGVELARKGQHQVSF